jgi:hypothetical protein
VAVLVMILALAPRVTAETGRTLGGYRFVPVSKIADPFITHHFGNATGVSIASNVEVPLLITDTTPPDTLANLSGDLLFIDARFAYQHVVHPRVAIGVVAGGLSRLGTSGEALLSQGVSATTSFGLGTKIELWRRENMLLSGLIDLMSGSILVVDLVSFVEDAIESGLENASIITTEQATTIEGSLAYAWAFNTWSGMTALGQLGYSEGDLRSDELLWRFAGAGSVDFGQRDQAPIGLAIGLDVDRLTPSSLAGSTAFSIGGGVHYTGREDLNLGLEVAWHHFRQVTRDITIDPVSFDLVLKYFF